MRQQPGYVRHDPAVTRPEATAQPAGERRRLLLARYRTHQAAQAAAREQGRPGDRDIIREHLIRAMERTTFCMTLAAFVILSDALPVLPLPLDIA